MTPNDIAVREPSGSSALALTSPETTAAALTHYLGTGDLAQLPADQRAALYVDMCASLGLNPRTRPFDWIEFYDHETRGIKLTLYPNRSCAEQLRRQHQISVRIVERKIVGKLFTVTVEGRRPNGVTETATSYVTLTDKDGNALVGQRLANAYMKGETVAKRRLTFSMVGMFSPPDLDELHRARVVVVDGTGRVLDNPTPEQRALAEDPRLARAIGEPTYEDIGASASPLAGQGHQRPAIDELTVPTRPTSRATFRCDKARWNKAWHALVEGTRLEADDARHRHISAYTASWPVAARTDSLSRFLAIITDVQAAEFVEATRQMLDEEAAARAADPDGELDGIDGLTSAQAHDEAASQAGYEVARAAAMVGAQRPSNAMPKQEAASESDDIDGQLEAATRRHGGRGQAPESPLVEVEAMGRVEAAARLTGAAPGAADPPRPAEGAKLSTVQWRAVYAGWAAQMKRLDSAFAPDDPATIAAGKIEAAAREVIARVDDMRDYLDALDDDTPSDERDGLDALGGGESGDPDAPTPSASSSGSAF